MRRGGRRRGRAGRGGDELGDVGHGARADVANRASIRGLRAHTFCHVAPGMWYLMGVVLSAGGAFAWYRDQLARDLVEHRRRERATQRRGGDDSAGRRRRDVPSVSAGRAHAASRRVGARRVPRTQSRALAGASHARGARGRVLRAARLRARFSQELGLSPQHMLLTGGGAQERVRPPAAGRGVRPAGVHGESRGGTGVRRGVARRGWRGRVPRSCAPRRRRRCTRGAARTSRSARVTPRTTTPYARFRGVLSRGASGCSFRVT